MLEDLEHDQDLDQDQDEPCPQGNLALQVTALPRDTNAFNDIYGGWLVNQMDLAATATASRLAGGRVATVAIDRMAFMVPVNVGADLAFYTQVEDIGRSSIKVQVEVWSDDPMAVERRKVTEALFVFVAIDSSGRTRSLPQR
ncbi:acyl-CoA thioesterase [Atopomonas sediminilitoris]|uniref:acyl-CoA thioesterase n=1 Tax=Atopomonas sediminilitoris TaxID=2919919 RepID=UPI001F4EA7C7|nr:acyl-CoA thioesterase [Atopomonas sediminilitoris]MCJ8169470.1 acyl-CoA thioesterase [Atopomonas sediminilitoris]